MVEGALAMCSGRYHIMEEDCSTTEFPGALFGDVDAKPGFLQLDVVLAGAWPRSAVRASFGTSGHASQCTLFSAWHLGAIWLIRAFQVR